MWCFKIIQPPPRQKQTCLVNSGYLLYNFWFTPNSHRLSLKFCRANHLEYSKYVYLYPLQTNYIKWFYRRGQSTIAWLFVEEMERLGVFKNSAYKPKGSSSARFQDFWSPQTLTNLANGKLLVWGSVAWIPGMPLWKGLGFLGLPLKIPNHQPPQTNN